MATSVLPEVVALCINSALNSGRNLSWKIQHSLSGTSVQLFWKSDRDSSEINRQSATAPVLPRKKRKSPSQLRRSQKRLENFLKRKSEVGSSRLLDNPEDENTSNLANADNVAAVVENQETSDQDIQELCLTAGSSSEVDKPPIAGDLNLNSSVVNLGSCSSVEFEQRGGVPGVSYVSADGGLAGWTPVRQCRRGRTRSGRKLNHNCDSDSDTEDLVIPRSAIVKYMTAADGSPGLHIATTKTRSWTPIAARTRSKSNLIT